jgi:hypothetical protein
MRTKGKWPGKRSHYSSCESTSICAYEGVTERQICLLTPLEGSPKSNEENEALWVSEKDVQKGLHEIRTKRPLSDHWMAPRVRVLSSTFLIGAHSWLARSALGGEGIYIIKLNYSIKLLCQSHYSEGNEKWFEPTGGSAILHYIMRFVLGNSSFTA